MAVAAVVVVGLVVGIRTPAHAAVARHVPQQYGTVAAAVAAASSGDEILISPGTYRDFIDGTGKQLTISSTHGAHATFFDGNVILDSDSSLRGLTFTARESFYLRATGDNVAVEDNVFAGIGGTSIVQGAAFVRGNLFTDVHCSGGVVTSYGSASVAAVTNNVIVRSGCDGIVAVIGSGTAIVANNTVIDVDGDGIAVGTGTTARNNIVTGSGIGFRVYPSTTPTIDHNLLFSNDQDYFGISDLSGVDGNLAADPEFDPAAHFPHRVLATSPAIDSGAAGAAPDVDFEGFTRPHDGDGIGAAEHDIGAHEFGQAAVGLVAGTIRNGDGLGVARMCVEAHAGTEMIGAALTDPSGAYSIALPPSAYTIRFDDCSYQVFAGKWFPSASDQAGATPVVVSSEATTDNIDGSVTTAVRCDGLVPTVVGKPVPDHIEGHDATDIVLAGGSHDTIHTYGGDDIVCAGDGNDLITTGDGADRVYGHGGHDYIASGSGDDSVRGGSGNDSLITGDGDDNVLGGPGNDTIRPEAGNDTVDAGAGDDVITPEAGDDAVVGGDGEDWLWYIWAPGVEVNLAAGMATGEGTDVIGGVENVRGSPYEDVLIGDDSDNKLWGHGGDDRLEGGAGRDELKGELGVDRAAGGPGADRFVLVEILDFSSAAQSVVVDLERGRASGEGADRIENSPSQVIGSVFNDTLRGDRFGNVLNGGAGDDTIRGLGGDDVLRGGSGNDTILGGRGKDAVTGGPGDDNLYGGASDDEIQGSAGQDTIRGNAGDDILIGGKGPDDLVGGDGADDIRGSSGRDVIDGGSDADRIDGGSGADTIEGGDADDLIEAGTGHDTAAGGDGDDLILGGGGNDDLHGDAGDDTLAGGTGDDTIVGGIGIDTASYAFASGGVTVDLATGRSSGAAGRDTIASTEQLVGSAHADTLRGDAADNLIEPRAGDDIVDGRAGTDLISFGYSAAGVEANMATGVSSGEGDDTFTSFEWLLGSDHDDLLRGSDAADVIFGLNGVNRILGGAGDDVLLGGEDRDVIKGHAGDDYLDGAGANNHLYGGSGHDTCVIGSNLAGCENLVREMAIDESLDGSGPSSNRHRPRVVFSAVHVRDGGLINR
ncbi:MAG: hypothetical protein GY720_20435 [bacterium]|nr:hypothetical protein [bacterium]